MNVDQKFNKRSAQQVPCNYTNVSWNGYEEANHQFVLVFYGNTGGDLRVRMNSLEAHRLVEQLNAELAKHTKALITKDKP